MAHVVTNVYSGTYAQGSGVCTYTVDVDAGTGTNRAILIAHYRRIDRAIAIQSVTIGGEAMEILDIDRQLSGNVYIRPFALVNPTVTGTQSLVITATTDGLNSSSGLIVSVYDDVDPNALEADLLAIAESETIVSPWTGEMTLDIPSATGNVAVAQLFSYSDDVAYNFTPSAGLTERVDSVGGGTNTWAGDAAGAATVSCSFTPTGLAQDLTSIQYGWDLPPPSAGASRVSLLRGKLGFPLHGKL